MLLDVLFTALHAGNSKKGIDIMFTKFVRCLLKMMFCVLFSVVCDTQAQSAFGPESDVQHIVVLHTSSVSPIHINQLRSMVSVTGYAEIMSLNAATGFSPRFDIALDEECERLILSGCEKREIGIAVIIEARSRGPPYTCECDRLQRRNSSFTPLKQKKPVPPNAFPARVLVSANTALEDC